MFAITENIELTIINESHVTLSKFLRLGEHLISVIHHCIGYSYWKKYETMFPKLK